MGHMIGTLDESTLYRQMTLQGWEPLARVNWSMTHGTPPSEFHKRHDIRSGVIQIFYPGPVIKYETNDGVYDVGIFNNGGDEKQSERVHQMLLKYAKR